MRAVILLVVAVAFSYTSQAQKTIEMRTLWQKPQVHVIYGDYVISFTIKDIDKTLRLLAESGDNRFPTACGLDTGTDHTVQLLADVTRQEYRSNLQILLQDGVGCFLIYSGHAFIQNKKHKPVRSILADEQPPIGDVKETYLEFYNAKTNERLFSGRIFYELHGRDLGID
jgi:hypothetical protein